MEEESEAEVDAEEDALLDGADEDCEDDGADEEAEDEDEGAWRGYSICAALVSASERACGEAAMFELPESRILGDEYAVCFDGRRGAVKRYARGRRSSSCRRC